MKDNFFISMFSEGGKISSKRFIGILFSIFAVWAGVYIVINYKEYALTVFGYTLIAIGLILSIFTLPQITSLIKGTTTKKEDEVVKKESL